ncbi:sugar phosphate isomerase/epimerase family protein [Xylophilus sp. GOD-11R]|uniref:sugar phosphate isomerase/epimerase family protein n=1 Tax=Xylophilus sp. GOD-11R TaxID=3089814 RepID=UPI00298CB8C2|nr:sugar phosphate isomerase/epimerase family protein [Xylophilus sp. GOD-11R]WPB58444.1 sugar phosphate isomerase/epimerase family protein [Xylophilus sp. GOD-11R]
MSRRPFLAAMATAVSHGAAWGAAPVQERGGLAANPSFVNTVLLGGAPEENLRAAQGAGFDGVEFWRREAQAVPGGAAAAGALARRIGIGLTDYQVLSDFDGAPGHKRAEKRAEALAFLDDAAAIGAPALAVPASTDPDCDAARVGEDLAWLVDQARRRGLRICYEGMAWSTVNSTLQAAWRAIRELDPAHIGLVVDSYHLFVRGGTAQDVAAIPPGRIATVQFCDVAGPVAPQDYGRVARSRRLLPGDGDLPLASLVEVLEGMGYAGPVGLEIFNDALHAQDPAAVAQRAMHALRSLLGASGGAAAPDGDPR